MVGDTEFQGIHDCAGAGRVEAAPIRTMKLESLDTSACDCGVIYKASMSSSGVGSGRGIAEGDGAGGDSPVGGAVISYEG